VQAVLPNVWLYTVNPSRLAVHRANATKGKPSMVPSPLRILVIDDDPEICLLLRSMLRREGFQVCAAEDGPSALELIGKRGFDLLITDIRLPPPMDGVETVKRARKVNPDLRSLFISGGNEARCADPDCDDFVRKPFNQREIVGCIWELVMRRLPRA
jgi:CheY-like chemotaxis protein